jgi:DNA-binding Lrp family transcriptional regulator
VARRTLILANDLDILNEVGRWKITNLQNLHHQVAANMTFSPFARRIKKLERLGLIKTFNLIDRKRKYLGLTEQGAIISRFKNVYDAKSDMINHDLIVANVLKELLEFEDILDGMVYHDQGLSVAPDAIVTIRRGGKNLRMAVEIELTQKNKRRFTNKFESYGKSQDFHFAMYVFNSRSVIRAYATGLKSMSKEVQDKIILCFDKSLSFRNFDYRQALYWYQGKIQSYKDLFE